MRFGSEGLEDLTGSRCPAAFRTPLFHFTGFLQIVQFASLFAGVVRVFLGFLVAIR